MRSLLSAALLGAALLVLAAGCATPRAVAFLEILGGAAVEPLAAPPGGAAVLIFITSDCPIANGYAPQLQAMMAGFRGRPVKFTLVHVDPGLQPEQARRHAAEYGYDGTIVLDPSHRLVARAGATITPEAAVYSGDGELRYRGRINNWYGDIGRKRLQPTRHELRDAIEAVLTGRPVAPSRTEAVGCTIEPLRD